MDLECNVFPPSPGLSGEVSLQEWVWRVPRLRDLPEERCQREHACPWAGQPVEKGRDSLTHHGKSREHEKAMQALGQRMRAEAAQEPVEAISVF